MSKVFNTVRGYVIFFHSLNTILYKIFCNSILFKEISEIKEFVVFQHGIVIQSFILPAMYG